MNSTRPYNLKHVKQVLAARLAGERSHEDVLRLIMHRLGVSREYLYAYEEHTISQTDRAWLEEAVNRRAAGMPLAYILGEAWFYGRRFVVDEHVLIPRPETEHLIDVALKCGNPIHRCLDVGTGSGCIAVTLACELPETHITAIDISEAALRTARENALRHGVSAGIRFIESSLLNDHYQTFELGSLASNFGPDYDMVIANLPYIPTPEIPQRPNPVGFEPILALDGGQDGLALYRELLRQLPEYLAPHACVMMEAAPPTIHGLLALMQTYLPMGEAAIGYDYAGLERYVVWESTQCGGRALAHGEKMGQ